MPIQPSPKLDNASLILADDGIYHLRFVDPPSIIKLSKSIIYYYTRMI